MNTKAPFDMPQLDSHSYGLRTDPYSDRGNYPDDGPHSPEYPAYLTWRGMAWLILAAPCCIVAEWWRRWRRG